MSHFRRWRCHAAIIRRRQRRCHYFRQITPPCHAPTSAFSYFSEFSPIIFISIIIFLLLHHYYSFIDAINDYFIFIYFIYRHFISLPSSYYAFFGFIFARCRLFLRSSRSRAFHSFHFTYIFMSLFILYFIISYSSFRHYYFESPRCRQRPSFRRFTRPPFMFISRPLLFFIYAAGCRPMTLRHYADIFTPSHFIASPFFAIYAITMIRFSFTRAITYLSLLSIFTSIFSLLLHTISSR